MKKALKRSLSFILAIVIIFNSALLEFSQIDFSDFSEFIKELTTDFSVKSQAASSGTCGENLTWTLDDEGTLTISGTGAMTNYSSSSTPWYNVRSSVTSVVIDNGVTNIGDNAFYGCSSLDSVTIPDSVTSIGSYAFGYCSKLTSITIPNSVTSIGNYAFYYCTSLDSVTIPDSVTSIGNYAFYYCTSLDSVTIPDSVTSIGSGAFYNCTSLDSVTIPDSVTSIGSYAFYNCTSLTSITIPVNVTSIGSGAFYNCTVITKINWNAKKVSSFSSSSNVFYNAGTAGSGIELIFGNTVEYIPAFLGYVNNLNYHSKITTVTIPDSVTSIGSYVFYGCTSLTSITIPDSVTKIGYQAFYGCTSLTSITIPDSVKSIDDSAFYGCTSLTSITIPDSVTSIGSSAFERCTSLTSIIIPDSVTSIGNSAFRNCTSLDSVTIPDSVTSIGSFAFAACDSLTSVIVDSSNANYSSIDGVLFNKDKTTLIQYPAGKTSATYTIPDSVTNIGQGSFFHCGNITTIVIPDSVTSIGSSAFYECSSLTSITIPDSVTSIGNGAFGHCSKLTSITIPNSVTSINYDTFCNCTSLTSITIPDSVTSIVSSAFEHCTSLTSITIPDSITSIREYAFYGCTSLTSITIPDSVTSIGHSAFKNCTSLASVTIGNGVTYIDDNTFSKCTSLTSITIPDSVTSISSSAFYGCTSLTIYGVKGTAAEQYATDKGFAFVEVESSHKHTSDVWVIDKNATCTTEGSRHKECTICGVTFETEAISATGHTETDWIIDSEATCTTAGSKHKECTVCGTILATETTDATGHTSSDWIKDSDLTCTIAGSRHKECTVCGTILEREVTDAPGHTSSDWIIDSDSTCTAEGTKHKECTVCGEIIETAVIPMLSHTPSDWYVASQPTCTTEGMKHIKCTVCNNVLQNQPIPTIPHDLDGDFVCTLCGQRIEGVARSYTIYVLDIETGKPIEGANVTLGNISVTTASDGAANFQILSNDATTLKISAKTYPDTNESSYTPINQRADYIYLTSNESDIYGAWCNGDNVINGDSQINARIYAYVADIVINGRAKANILRYELIQDSAVIATSADGVFEVRNTSFKIAKDVIVRMYTNGREGHNVFERKLNIKVVGYVFNADVELDKFLPFINGFNVSIPDNAGCFAGLDLSFPNPFAKSSEIEVHYQNDKVIVTLGMEQDFNGGSDEPKDILKTLVDEWVKQKKDKSTHKAHGSMAVVIEFDENGVSDVYGQVNIGFELEFPYGKTFMVSVVPVRVDIVTRFNGELEITNIKYDEDKARLYSEYEFPINGSISLYGGVGCRLLSAGVYGQAGIQVVFSSDQPSTYEKLMLYGEVGLYVKYKRLFRKAKYQTLPLWHDQKIWPEHLAATSAMLYSANAYDIDPREYLQNRTEWLNATLMSNDSTNVLLQDSTYTAIEPRIIQCGDTIMMLFFDDDGSEGINYQHLYYSIYDKASGGWSEPRRLDDNNRCDIEFDVYANDSSIYVSYIEIDNTSEEDQDDDEKILGTAEVVVAQYDFTSGQFTNHTNISNNDTSDSLPTISETVDGITVTWVNNFTNDVFSQNANNMIYFASLEGQEWSEAEAITDRGATIVSMDVGSIDEKSYIAIIRDIDCDLSTAEDRVLYLIDLDGNITEIVNEVNTNDGAQFVEMNGEDKLIWYNNQNLYYINSVSDAPAPVFASAVSGLSANYKFTQIDSDSYAITFIQNDMSEDGEGNVLNGSSVYGIFCNDGVWGNAVPIVLNESGYYIDAYDVCMSDGKMLIPYINADVTITETDVTKTTTFLSTTFELRNDIVAGKAEFLPSQLFEGETIEVFVPVTNNSWQGANGFTYDVKDSQGNVVYSGIWEQFIDSGATEYLTIILQKDLLSQNENYSLHIHPTDLVDIDTDNNISELLFWYTDFVVAATKNISNDNQEIQYTITNDGNIVGNAILKVYKIAADGTEIVLEEIEISNLGIGETLSDSLTVTQDYYGEDSEIGTVFLCVVPEKTELYSFNDSVSLSVGAIEYNETTGGDSSAIIIENPVISEPYIQYDKANSGDISVQISENGCTFGGINELSSQDYSYNDATVTISNDYLATLSKGYHYFTFSYTNSGITTEVVLIVEIIDTSYESVTISAGNQEAKYDGFALELGKDIVYSTESQGAVTSEYSVDNGTTWVAGLPTDIGEYLVRLTVAQDDENGYLSANHTFTVTIKKGMRAVSVPLITGTSGSQVLFGNSVPTIGSTDGTILYGYSLTNDVSTVIEWNEVGMLPKAQTYTTYYVFAKIINSEKYEDAYSIGYPVEAHIHEYESTIVAPTVESKGYTLHTCSGCNDQYKDNFVEKIELVYGDCDGDGMVTTEDLERLRRYFANKDPLTGKSTVTLQTGADCNGDKNITMVDLAMLRKYLENLNPVTGESSVVLGPK